MLAEGLFVKALQNLETGELLKNSLCGKLVSSLVSQKTFDEIFSYFSVQISIY